MSASSPPPPRPYDPRVRERRGGSRVTVRREYHNWSEELLSYEDLESRLRDGRNIAWTTAPIGDDGLYPDKCWFCVTQVNSRAFRMRTLHQVSPEDAERFVDALRSRALVPFANSNHNLCVRLRHNKELAQRERRGDLYRKRRPVGAAVVAVVALLLIAALPGVRASGWTPVTPNLSSQIDKDSVNALATTPTTFWSTEAIAFNQSFQPPATFSGGLWALKTGWSNLTLMPLPSGVSLIAPSTFNLIQVVGCGAPCSPSRVLCDGTVVNIFPAPYACFHLEIDWPGGNDYHNVPIYNIERVQTWLLPVFASWTVKSCNSISVTAIFVAYGPGFLNSEAVNKIVTWNIIVASWVQPLPSNVNIVSGSYEVEDLSTSTFLASTQFYIGTTYSLLQWSDLPSPSFQSGPPYHASNASRSYFFHATLSCSGPGSIGGSGTGNKSTPGLNGGTPGVIPGPELPPQTVVLVLGNITTIDSGNLSSSVQWTNPNAFAFSGAFVLEAPFLPGGSNIHLFENSAPATSGTYSVLNDSLNVVQGTAVVQNGSTISFEVTWEKGSTWTVTTPLIVVNGVSFSLGALVVLGTLALGALLIAVYLWRTGSHSQWLETALGLALSGLVIGGMWLQ